MLGIRIIRFWFCVLLENRNDGIIEMDSLEEDEPISSEAEETTTETETSEVKTAPLPEEKTVDNDNNAKEETQTKEEEDSEPFLFFKNIPSVAPKNCLTIASWKSRSNSASVPAENEPPLKKQKHTSSKTSR